MDPRDADRHRMAEPKVAPLTASLPTGSLCRGVAIEVLNHVQDHLE